MTDEEQNRAICEAIGRRYHKPTPEEIKSGSYYQYEPNFACDRNAMCEVIVEKICGDKEIEDKFLNELNAIIDGYADSEDVPVICDYTMAQIVAPCWALARAFLRTVGKWKE